MASARVIKKAGQTLVRRQSSRKASGNHRIFTVSSGRDFHPNCLHTRKSRPSATDESPTLEKKVHTFCVYIYLLFFSVANYPSLPQIPFLKTCIQFSSDPLLNFQSNSVSDVLFYRRQRCCRGHVFTSIYLCL